MSKKIDTTKTYKLRFKDEDAERQAWIHIHCRLAEVMDCTEGGGNYGTAEEERLKAAHRITGEIFQMMSLYDDVRRIGWAYGSWLADFEAGSQGILRYIDYKAMTPEEYENRGSAVLLRGDPATFMTFHTDASEAIL